MNLRKIPGTPAGVPGTPGDKQGSTGRCARDFLLSKKKRETEDRKGHFCWDTGKTLSFLSLLVWISLVNFKQGISLLKFVFSLSFPGILWVWQGQKILGKFGGFPW